ncbi:MULTISPECIES: ImmA/IrrE family metallo-endopeptidase [Pseudomonas]|uniref:helix-turn-helix domain-containing protein n=1 Tax=Pseudomonas TaxID=286 RepID=UPI001AE533AB|nr:MULTISPECIES: ImmA/IrrE family metallo-endopeptidase [unclassified Pseudomonas]MBP1127198.1 Zn-dependent peptidase ImmA (M78 family)/DNA-binding XRE family transcriptional regulator [Pseudomonas sp. PvP025]MDQ0401058.1 Zn-dependent peptidase ImmA (M78 family)/transcriptional regulator with XRE-family HTH domain [Pseudomonas sp. PvP006]
MRTGVAGFQSERLKQLRLAFGMTQTTLAEMVGRASGNISKWENGLQVPEADAFQRLCEVFGVSENWLLEEQFRTDENTPFFFRSQVSATTSAREIAEVRLGWLQEVSYKLQESLEFIEVNVPHLEERHCELISDEEIEQMASLCRQTWGLGIAPISNVVQVLENAGVVCARTTLGHLKMDGVSNWYELDQRPYVLLVADKANGIRNRFDAAHELGHVVLHRYISKEQYDSHYALLEAQAHRFASAFLLPAESFLREVRWPTLDTLLALKPRWKVSVAAMVRRCLDLEIINDTTTTRLWKARSARGWVKGEPMDSDFGFEKPQLIARGVKMLVENDVLSRSQVRQLLGLPLHIMENLCSLDEGYFNLPDKSQVIDIQLRKRSARETFFSETAEILGFPSKK